MLPASAPAVIVPPSAVITPAYLRPKEAARYLGVSTGLLAKIVRKGEGPRERRIGRAVLYSRADLDAFMDRMAA